MGANKRFLAAFLAWLLLCSGALAEFSPRYNELIQEGALALTVSGQLQSLDRLSQPSLEIVNGFLEGLELGVRQGKTAGLWISRDGERLLSATVTQGVGYTLTAFSPSGGAYLTDPAGPDALALITGGGYALPDFSLLPGLYAQIAPEVYAALEKHAPSKLVKEATSVKNAATSASYRNYVFPDGKLNEAWPEVLEALLPALRSALNDQPRLLFQAEALLKSLTFSGECRFKRFLDKAGNDMGLQFTGRAAWAGDERKVTLFGGFTPDKGGSLSLTLPGVGNNKNTLKASFALKLTEKKNARTLTAEGSLDRTLNGASASYALDVSLNNALSEDGERWTGKVTYSAAENKVKTVWTFTPDLVLEEAGLSGAVAVQRKTGNRVTLKAALTARLAPAEEGTASALASARDLRYTTQEKARGAVTAELAPLTGALAALLAKLPEAERTLLLHELRTDEWMNGPAAPALTENDADDDWVVKEDEW